MATSPKKLRTGDIVLFNEYSNSCWLSYVEAAIRCCTNSIYSHVGIVLVDPPWAPAGTYIWDSSRHMHPDPQDNKIKFGIALVPLDEYVNIKTSRQQLYVRSPVDPAVYDRFTPEKLSEIHDAVYGKHYDLDLGHWLAGMFHTLIPRTTDRFFCSAFASFFLAKCGVLADDTDWTVVSPAMLSSRGKGLAWRAEYGDDEKYP